jgi:hypothetical protein
MRPSSAARRRRHCPSRPRRSARSSRSRRGDGSSLAGSIAASRLRIRTQTSPAKPGELTQRGINRTSTGDCSCLLWMVHATVGIRGGHARRGRLTPRVA